MYQHRKLKTNVFFYYYMLVLFNRVHFIYILGMWDLHVTLQDFTNYVVLREELIAQIISTQR